MVLEPFLAARLVCKALMDSHVVPWSALYTRSGQSLELVCSSKNIKAPVFMPEAPVDLFVQTKPAVAELGRSHVLVYPVEIVLGAAFYDEFERIGTILDKVPGYSYPFPARLADDGSPALQAYAAEVRVPRLAVFEMNLEPLRIAAEKSLQNFLVARLEDEFGRIVAALLGQAARTWVTGDRRVLCAYAGRNGDAELLSTQLVKSMVCLFGPRMPLPTVSRIETIQQELAHSVTPASQGVA